jgi:predicted N-acyltransferase
LEPALKIRVHERIDQIAAAAWNRLLRDNNPFLRHEFLLALERHNCVGEKFGWLPRHIAVYDGRELIGAMPLYEKENSYGEFVFDHAWADAYRHAGLNYFPKLVSAIPYTPATGQRLLARPDRAAEVWPLLLSTALELSRQTGASGFHCLFPAWEEQDFLEGNGLISRHDCQFHWQNRGYADFDAFLGQLTARKRKKIRHERRKVERSGVVLRRLDGHTASERDWQHFSRFYNHTFAEKWGIATFNYPFFLDVARQLPDQVLLVLADRDGECIAGSLMYHSDTTLYGRHWGSVEQVDSLHFEACYYQGIEFCIEHGLKLFEPGAQGEHKIARGFLPVLTRSSHWLVDEHFRGPVAAFARHERKAIADYMRQLEQSDPYRKEEIA